MAPVQSADEMFEYLGRLGTAPEEAGVAVLALQENPQIAQISQILKEKASRNLTALKSPSMVFESAKSVDSFSDGGPWVGKPRFYISHGKQDPILPIEKCGRRIAHDLDARAYGVTLKEFDGGHEIPAAVLSEAFAGWAHSEITREAGISIKPGALAPGKM